MRVSVALPTRSQSVAPAVKQALDAYLFESRVQVTMQIAP